MRFLKLALIGVLAVLFASCGDSSNTTTEVHTDGIKITTTKINKDGSITKTTTVTGEDGQKMILETTTSKDGTKVVTTIVDNANDDESINKLPPKVIDGDYEETKCYNSFVAELGGKCRYVQVRAEPDNLSSTRTLDIYYSVIPARDQANKKEPIVFLMGGPGPDTSHYIYMILGNNSPHSKLNKTHDYIFVDYRGTGFSQPFPYCSDEISKYDMVEYVNTCIKNLDPSIHTEDYTSHNNAYDVAQILKQEGIKKANLIGVSYGTRVAMTIVRDYPEVVNKVVLDGFMAIEANGISQAKEAMLDKLDFLASKYNKEYPNEDFKARLEKFIDSDSSSNKVSLLRGFAIMAYKDGVIANIKQMFDETEVSRSKDSSFVSSFKERLLSDNDFIDIEYQHLNYSSIMSYAIILYEEFAFVDRQKPYTFGFGNKVIDALDSFKGGAPSVPLEQFNIKIKKPNALEMQPVASSKPILILSAGKDFQTPLYWAKNAQKHLSNAKHFFFKNETHGFTLRNFEAIDIVNDFYNTNDINSLDSKTSENFEQIK